ncbi:MAG: cupredoxin domain-containing protein [Deltaproteobacteria bacterium]|nr:cupredoxin domain-containing protein [Deltaproteobacteria bacterium]
MTRSILAALVVLAAACGSGSSIATSRTPITDPIPMIETPAQPARPVDAVIAVEPAPVDTPAEPDPSQVKADLLAVEMAAYETARPVFEKYCVSCHSKGQKGAKAKTLEHFEITTYPFKGHHAEEVGASVRKSLGIDGGKPTMPKNKPGIVQGAELAAIAGWAAAFDAAHAGGAHEGRDRGDHDHHAVKQAEPTRKPIARPAKPAATTRIDIAVTRAGFEPKNVTVARGKPVILRFERVFERTCGTEVVMVVDGKKIVKDLPLNTPVELAITFGTPGVVKYACAMDMIRGTVTVQ